MDRRSLLLGGTALAGLAALPFIFRAGAAMAGEGEPVPGIFEVTHTDEEWRKILGEASFNIMRRQGTEPPWTSALLNEHREGQFLCKGCDLPLFDAATKYDSGTGWPSFYQPLDNAVGTMEDRTYGIRTEVHCRRCGGHLGHVFNDGPAPTGLRYCMDGVALKFEPKAA
ncbi:MAG: peptide-methionine (R)-S-oxide reductase MsrB [Devosia sp.]